MIVASRVSKEKYKELQTLMKEGESRGVGGFIEECGQLEYLPTPRLLVLKPHAKKERPPSIGR